MYEKLKLSEVVKPVRYKPSRFESTPEWEAMKADMDKGWNPRQFLSVSLTEEDKERYGITNRRTIARFLEKYIDRNGLNYTVEVRRDGGVDFIQVKYAEAK